MKRSIAVDGAGIPLGRVLAPASRHDSVLLAGTLDELDGMTAKSGHTKWTMSRPLGTVRGRCGSFASTANKVAVFLRPLDAGLVVPQVPVPLVDAKNRRKVPSQLVSCERQVRGMHDGCHRATVDATIRRCQRKGSRANGWARQDLTMARSCDRSESHRRRLAVEQWY
jgi:hypothetical protein